MTDGMAALGVLVNPGSAGTPGGPRGLPRPWQGDALVIDKWFAIQATCRLDGTVEAVRRLAGHPAFDLKVPNRARSLVGAFAMA